MLNPIIVYHAKSEANLCFDGFLAATIFWRKYGESAEYIRALYHKSIAIDKFVGRDVIFVDFSFDLETMDQIFSVAKSLIVLDHHEPSSPEFLQRSYTHCDKTACGAILAWRHVYGDKKIPTMLEIIDDGDRFLNVTPDLVAFHCALSVEEVSFKNWSNLLDTLILGSPEYTSFVKKGAVLEKYDEVRISSLVKEAFSIELCGMTGLAVNANKFYAHNVAIKLAEFSKTFGAVFYLRADGNIEVSLRRVDPEVDVRKIANAFGGNGHKGAAGFSVSLAKFSEFINIPKCDDFAARLDTVTKLFQFPLNAASIEDLDAVEEEFYRHLESELGPYIAQDIGFHITKSVSHPNLSIRFMSYIAQLIGLSKVVLKPSFIHKLFPYKACRKLSFDEDSIRNVLLSGKPDSKQVNEFFIERLLDTVNVTYPLELITSTHYIHVTVSIPNSPLTIKHTFEVSK